MSVLLNNHILKLKLLRKYYVAFKSSGRAYNLFKFESRLLSVVVEFG